MSTLRAGDPRIAYEGHAGLHTSFAGFNDELLLRIEASGSKMHCDPGSVLFKRGARDVDMFIVLNGELEIHDQDGLGPDHVIAILGRGQFTGELDLLDKRPSLVTCKVREHAHVLRLGRAALSRIMRADTEIADIVMQACIGRRFDLIRYSAGGILLLGKEHSADTIRLQRFLTRNSFPFHLLNAARNSDACAVVRSFALDTADLPVVVLPDQKILRNPTNAQLADALELTDAGDLDAVYDVAIVGAGPAGLAAAVYASSEGLSTAVIEGSAPGGQAGTSSRIENYLGFPTGISGQELSERSQIQAQKFGARFMISRDVTGLSRAAGLYALMLSDGESVRARAVVIATGARYQRLDIPNYDRFEYQGIHYAATAMEADLCRGEEVVVVGAGNSAGQAALFLSQTASHVRLLVRGTGLQQTMSDYLIQRIAASRAITVHLSTEIVALEGDERLHEVTWIERQSMQQETRRIGNVFIMIGALPRTEWLADHALTDSKGFIVTGVAAGSDTGFGTRREGIFAVGDVRSGSVKRVASAVGEGSVVISEVHRYLAKQTELEAALSVELAGTPLSRECALQAAPMEQ